MKTSHVLTSLLFGSLAVAAPVDRRALVTKLEVVTETVVIYTTVWDYEATNVALPTSTPGLFFEKPKPQPSKPASSKAEPTSTPAYTPPVVEEPSSAYTPPPVVTPSPEPTPTPTPTPTPEPQPQPQPEEPKPSLQPTPTPEPQPEPQPEPAPQPAPSSAPAAPQPSQPSTPSTGNGQTYDGEITVYDTEGGFGSCGKQLNDQMMICALSASTMGASTYDVMTGNPTNPWCGKSVVVSYNGNSITCTIEDKCPGCAPGSLDLSRAAWNQLTGGIGGQAGDRLKASWQAV